MRYYVRKKVLVKFSPQKKFGLDMTISLQAKILNSVFSPNTEKCGPEKLRIRTHFTAGAHYCYIEQ